MSDRAHETAHNHHEATDDIDHGVNVVAGSLDAFLDELISHTPGITFCAATVSGSNEPKAEIPPATKAEAITKTEPSFRYHPEPTPETGPPPARVYSMSDLMLFEHLTGYRLVAQRQLWRSVDKDGNRAMAADRLFTVLAEEAFQLADRQRRNGHAPQADLTVHDIAAAMKPMRAIAAHLGERGNQASDRLEAVLMAAIDRPLAA